MIIKVRKDRTEIKKNILQIIYWREREKRVTMELVGTS